MVDRHLLLGIIQGDEGVPLKDPYSPDPFDTHPTGGQIRDASRFKLKSRIRDIDLIGDDRDADSRDRDDGRLDQVQRNVNVMDHQIQDNINIRIAVSERTKTVTFNEARVPHDGIERLYRAVESLDMTNLKDSIVTPAISTSSSA